MIDTELYIEQGLKVVKNLLSQGNLPAALNACQELLKVNPYHRKVQKYLKEIEERIIEQNEEKVERDIAETMHLWKEGRFDELMKIYSQLYRYAPGNKKLRNLIEKLNSSISEQAKNQRSAFIADALAAIEGLLKEKRFGETIQACNELLSVDPLNKNAAELLNEAKEQLIEAKLRENERLIDSADFERAIELYQSLLSINPQHKKVRQLLELAKDHFASQKFLAEKIHLNESIMRMKQLFKNGEYEKVIQACEEISRLDPKNFTSRAFRKKAKKVIEEEIDRTVVKKLKETWAQMENEVKKTPQDFLRV